MSINDKSFDIHFVYIPYILTVGNPNVSKREIVARNLSFFSVYTSFNYSFVLFFVVKTYKNLCRHCEQIT